jgi:RimJ/RimL family protein N-acetyltransferase
MLRGMVARLHGAGCDGHWMIVDGEENVGLCGYVAPPNQAGEVEIGYGVAPERRKRGYATRAIGLLLAEASVDPAVTVVIAETVADNTASKTVLIRNGFTHTLTRNDSTDGLLDIWRLTVKAPI